MKRLIGPLVLGTVLGLTAHLAIIAYAPAIIMDRAMTMLGKRGFDGEGFTLAPQMRPDTQSVVRPSPDLAYSGCLFDLAETPAGIRVRMAAYDGYSSVSFFDAQTNNFRTIRGNGKAQETVLVPQGTAASEQAALVSPSDKGIILIRRLAPTDDAYAKVAEVAKGDVCEAL